MVNDLNQRLMDLMDSIDQVSLKLGELVIEASTANDLKALEMTWRGSGEFSENVREIMKDRKIQYEALHSGGIP